jgi:Zn finger protein HypA/HybF involved in hydrogenase expression
MSELNRLRKLLDEAGVSYLNHRTDVTIGYYSDDPHSVIEAMDHSLQVTGLTARQVMRALGHSSNCTNSERTTTVDETETLHARGDTWGTKEFDKKVIVHVMECSECGGTYEHVNGDYEFCPRCGRRIVEVDA